MRSRIDWKYVLSLELTDLGFDSSVLSEFRDRLKARRNGGEIADDVARPVPGAWSCESTRAGQRTDSTHVVAAIRTINRLEGVGETLRAALNSRASVVPEWVQAHAPREWYERYEMRMENFR